jgi:hypothetical protein
MRAPNSPGVQPGATPTARRPIRSLSRFANRATWPGKLASTASPTSGSATDPAARCSRATPNNSRIDCGFVGSGESGPYRGPASEQASNPLKHRVSRSICRVSRRVSMRRCSQGVLIDTSVISVKRQKNLLCPTNHKNPLDLRYFSSCCQPGWITCLPGFLITCPHEQAAIRTGCADQFSGRTNLPTLSRSACCRAPP